ncbi:uncharacterized protein E0L32_002301 [Thyridium curvatum]|uniref:Uncharacterized protein n=1 Tax=Thyridium curvatum TaxID=1093900 RepID=A0A507AD19_9PEZI|nr:uncharacterized protein E0L32_002301 [Thyridium curvatum]TPX06805.1 hypothetical protein E0L32_002301 [Thyridium curvatum]
MASNCNQTTTAAGTTAPGSGVPTSGATAGAPSAHPNTGERTAQGIKGVFAQGHGIGESLRGNINSAIDTLTGDHTEKAKDEEVARGGFREFANKEFEKKGTTDKAL